MKNQITITDLDLNWDYNDGFYRTYELSTKGHNLESCMAGAVVREFNEDYDCLGSIAVDDLPIRMYELVERLILKELNKAARIEAMALEEMIESYNKITKRKLNEHKQS